MKLLFCESSLGALIDQLRLKLAAEIGAEDPDYLLSASETDLVEHYVSKYSLDVPVLFPEKAYIESQGDADVDVSGDSGRYFSAGTAPILRGSQVVIAVPFSGDRNLFDYRTNPFNMNPPRAEVRDGIVLFTYEGVELSSEAVRGRYESAVPDIEQWLGWMRDEASRYNQQIENDTRTALARRREKILRDRNMVASLGLPIKPRPGEAETYKVPDVQRKLKVTKPKPPKTQKAFVPEPTLDAAVYDEIIGIVKGMAHVMERSPSAFKKMTEEDLRQHFLMQLNGQFEGFATGETFNYEGKTDILIRRDDRNVFIAECKFWSGPKSLTGAIDQILGYLAWRDTKAAVILFVRGNNFSDVLAKFVPLVEQHPSHKKTLASHDETDFRFVFGQRHDPNREVHLAVLAFPVPTD